MKDNHIFQFAKVLLSSCCLDIIITSIPFTLKHLWMIKSYGYPGMNTYLNIFGSFIFIWLFISECKQLACKVVVFDVYKILTENKSHLSHGSMC